MRGFICGIAPAVESGCGVNWLDSRCLGALGALGYLELYALTFLQAAEALAADRRKMDENVRPSIHGCDETETLGVVEPFNRTKTHCENLWIHGMVRQDVR
jgi:hypothetical protein